MSRGRVLSRPPWRFGWRRARAGAERNAHEAQPFAFNIAQVPGQQGQRGPTTLAHQHIPLEVSHGKGWHQQVSPKTLWSAEARPHVSPRKSNRNVGMVSLVDGGHGGKNAQITTLRSL